MTVSCTRFFVISTMETLPFFGIIHYITTLLLHTIQQADPLDTFPLPNSSFFHNKQPVLSFLIFPLRNRRLPARQNPPTFLLFCSFSFRGHTPQKLPHHSPTCHITRFTQSHTIRYMIPPYLHLSNTKFFFSTQRYPHRLNRIIAHC